MAQNQIPPQTFIIDGRDILNANASEAERRLSSAESAIATIPKSFTYVQSQAATVWTVNHNLGRFPAVSVVDSAGSVVIGDVTYVSVNTLTVAFSAPFSGNVYCS